MMTIDDAIKHCEEVAEANEKNAESMNNIYKKSCIECAFEHRQLAEWLKELKAYRNIINNAPQIVIDTYGSDIIEGYVDIYDMLREVQKNDE